MLTTNGNVGSSTYATATTLIGDIFADCGQCIQIGSYYQGLSIAGGNFSGGINAIEVPASLTGSLDEMVISATQFGYFTGVGIIDINTLYQNVHISNSEFDLQPNSSGINGTMTLFSVAGNSFYAPNATGTIGIHLLYGGGSSSASGNNSGTIASKFHSLAIGIALDASSAATLGKNSFTSVTTPVLNNSASTVVTDLGDITVNAVPTGYVGEIKSVSVPTGSAVSMPAAGTATNIATFPGGGLTPGTWRCSGAIQVNSGGSTITNAAGAISIESATLPTADSGKPIGGSGSVNSGANFTFGISSGEITVVATTPLYFVGSVVSSVGTPAAFGYAACIRSR